MDLTPIVVGLCLPNSAQDELDLALIDMADTTGDVQAAAREAATRSHGKLMALANTERRPQPIMVLP